jgi:hypothetical protein
MAFERRFVRAAAAGAILMAVLSLPIGSAPGQDDSTVLTRPTGHFRVDRPADLSPRSAETLYQNIRSDMASAYALAQLPKLRDYVSWRRFNKAPYRSSTHGARFVNNYANKLGRAYGAFENAGEMPVGAVVVKDSFSATVDGEIFAGPLFVMEKMEPGFNTASSDWRYAMIMPDGSLFGETGGANAESVEFCIACHSTREAYDNLFFLPQAFRLQPAKADINR